MHFLGQSQRPLLGVLDTYFATHETICLVCFWLPLKGQLKVCKKRSRSNRGRLMTDHTLWEPLLLVSCRIYWQPRHLLHQNVWEVGPQALEVQFSNTRAEVWVGYWLTRRRHLCIRWIAVCCSNASLWACLWFFVFDELRHHHQNVQHQAPIAFLPPLPGPQQHISHLYPKGIHHWSSSTHPW